jgi:hypothetical protein
MNSPQYATALGLVVFGANGHGEDAVHGRRRSAIGGRIQRWLADLWT